MSLDVVLLENATDQKAYAAAKWEALAFQLLEIVLGLAEGRCFEPRVGAGWEVKDRNDDLTFAVFEAGEACTQRRVGRGLEADPQPRRENRLGERQGDCAAQCKGRQQVKKKPTEHATKLPKDAGSKVA